MTQLQQGKLPFCGLTLVMYSTGNKAPKMEFQASSNKAKFKCTLTKNLYELKDFDKWLATREVQEYVRSGHVLKWGSKIVQGEQTKYSDGLQLEITYYMVKPFTRQGYAKPTMQQPQAYRQPQQSVQLTDDELPHSEKEWSQGDATEFNPEQYEQELG